MIDRRVRVLRMVATCGTVTGAAEALHYTPSAVSQQLRTLANDLGVELVVQDGRRIRLTPAARVLLDQTESLYARWEEIRGLVALADDEGGGALRLCGFSTAAAALLPRVAARLAETQPSWQVRIIEVEPKQCFDLLLADQADVAVVVATAELPSADDPRFELNQLLMDRLDLLLPENHRLAHEPHVQLADLADEAWIIDSLAVRTTSCCSQHAPPQGSRPRSPITQRNGTPAPPWSRQVSALPSSLVSHIRRWGTPSYAWRCPGSLRRRDGSSPAYDAGAVSTQRSLPLCARWRRSPTP